jgi:hypothetical protein
MALRDKQVISDMRYVLPFGRYKGETIAQVLKDDPFYLVWANDEVDWLDLDHKILELAENNGKEIHEDKSTYAKWWWKEQGL